jgi:hypothetical protein
MFGASLKICRENPDLVKIVEKTSGSLHEDQRVFHIIVSSIYSAKINGTHCCFSMETFTLYIMLPTAQIYVNSTEVRVVTFT